MIDGEFTDYCGNDKLKELRTEAKDEAYEFWFDFESNAKKARKGFRCHIIGESADGTSPTTAEPPTTGGPVTTSAPGGKPWS